jgi:hypothetical protein
MEDIKSPVVKDFIETAGNYCLLLEESSRMRTGELFSRLQQLLPMLYLKGAMLPTPKYCYEEEPKKFVKEDDYAHIHDSLQQKIEIFLGITHMSPGTRPSQSELISFSLAESFTDIYEEMKNYIKLYEVGLPQAMNDAIWLSRTSFEQSLGTKLLAGLTSLHQLVYNMGSAGSRALKDEDFSQLSDEEEPWFSDDQEEVYGDDE